MTPTVARRHLARAAATVLLGLAACASPGADPQTSGPSPAVSAVTREICGLVADGAVSREELTALGRVLDRAHDLGLPDDLLDAAHEIVTAGEASDDAVAKLRDACA